MNAASFDNAVESIYKKDPRFSKQAYCFLREALDFTIQRIVEEEGKSRHVTGGELLDGFKCYALQEFGPLAATVMREWGVGNGYHVGEMVYALIAEDIFGEKDSDSLLDFKKSPSFKVCFEKPYEPKDKKSNG